MMDEQDYVWIAQAVLAAGVATLWAMLRKISRQTCELHRVHLGANAMDSDGAPKWYVRQALTENVKDLTEAIQGLREVMIQQREILSRITEQQKDMHELVQTIVRRNK
jgi:hypothetical protein